MATLLLQSAGSFLGGAIGGPVGAAFGRLGGGLLGSAVDQALLSHMSGRSAQGPRLETMPVLSCEEGASIPRIYGRVRIGGQIIWASRFEEQSTTTRTGSSGKFGTKSAKSNTTYQYYANFAVGLCEGPITQLRRIWADGRELDQSQFNIRVYRGDEDQLPDPLLVAKEGWGVPAFRGTAYVVFEHFPIAEYGNRIPQLSFEVVRSVQGLAQSIQGVNIIPGSTEYGYATSKIMQLESGGASVYENRHQLLAETDWTASIDALQALCPNLKSVVLVVSWFGDDLRAGQCSIAPRVERKTKQTPWSVAGLDRTAARAVSLVDGKPAYGGTPTDASIVEAIADLKARGLSVVFSPFLMMDVPVNGDASGQTRFPWRGQISCDPPPGAEASIHGTQEARRQIEAFFGSDEPPVSEWSYRRFILHYAKLCARAGGVDAFLLGSELVSLTPVDDGSSEPAIDALVKLAAAVKLILGRQAKVSYAANWTEYGSWSLDGKTFKFPLDRLWSCTDIDFVGIDFYPPLTDWREGMAHADAALATNIYDRDYMRSRLRAGEAFDWYYADFAARQAQVRSSISDLGYDEAWMFRPKDLAGWWSSFHYARDDGHRRHEPTAWVPKSKPIWLIECGCAAIDRASNAPHVFFDAKAGAISAPYFSRASRDDLVQEAAIEAILNVYGQVSDAANPLSPVYHGPMIDASRIHIWSWDARPYPAFPALTAFWSDGGNWAKGHWLNGRLESPSLADLLQALWSDFGAGSLDVPSTLAIKLDGFCVDQVMSLREAVEPLATFFRFHLVDDFTQARVVSRRGGVVAQLNDDDLADADTSGPFDVMIDQALDVPHRLELAFCDGDDQYRKTSLAIQHEARGDGRQLKLDLPIVISASLAQTHGEDLLQDLLCARERVSFKLRRGRIDLQIGDIVTVPRISSRQYQIERLADGDFRSVTARAMDPALFGSVISERTSRAARAPRIALPPDVHFIELAGFGASSVALQFVAVTARQWLGPMAVWRRVAGSYKLETVVEVNATSGSLLSDLQPSLPQLIRPGVACTVELEAGALQSAAIGDVWAGANRLALQHGDGSWELLAFLQAKLLGPRRYELSGILRGIGGCDPLAAREVARGSRFVLLDDAIVPLSGELSNIGVDTTWRVGLASQDHSSSAFRQVEARLRGLTLLPWAPSHLVAKRVDGAIQLQFIRRSRAVFDLWDVVDMPLGEDVEAYELDILRNGTVIRTLKSVQPSFHYEPDLEMADFGQPQTSIETKLYQMSAVLGRGIPASQIISIM